MMRTPNTSHSLKWSWLRHAVQIAALLLFAAPLLVAGWGLFGVSVGGDDPVPTPADLPFFGSLSSSSIGGVTLLDPFGVLQVVAASKTFELERLWFALPVVAFYGLVRARAFCGWVCPVNLLLELDVYKRQALPAAPLPGPRPRPCSGPSTSCRAARRRRPSP